MPVIQYLRIHLGRLFNALLLVLRLLFEFQRHLKIQDQYLSHRSSSYCFPQTHFPVWCTKPLYFESLWFLPTSLCCNRWQKLVWAYVLAFDGFSLVLWNQNSFHKTYKYVWVEQTWQRSNKNHKAFPESREYWAHFWMIVGQKVEQICLIFLVAESNKLFWRIID